LGVASKSILAMLIACMPFAATCLLTVGFCVHIAGIPIADIGLNTRAPALSQAGGGLAIGLLFGSSIFLAGRACGWFYIAPSQLSSNPSKGLPVFCGALAYTVTASALEEIAYRGCLFALLLNTAGVPTAVVGSTAVFALSHFHLQTRCPALYVINACLFGLLITYCRLATGALWLPIGVHIGANLTSVSVFGMPIAGQPNNRGLITCVVKGPELITGGNYSYAAGFLGTVGLLAAGSAAMLLAL